MEERVEDVEEERGVGGVVERVIEERTKDPDMLHRTRIPTPPSPIPLPCNKQQSETCNMLILPRRVFLDLVLLTRNQISTHKPYHSPHTFNKSTTHHPATSFPTARPRSKVNV